MPHDRAGLRGSKLTASVALCTWNGGHWIGRQLESILSQTRQVDEIWIFDDKSTDDTCDIIRGILAGSRIRWTLIINETNIGSSRNFQNASAACTGDIIFFADQDDIWHPNKVSRILNEFEMSPETGWVFSDLELVDEGENSLGKTMWSRIGFGASRLSRFEKGNQLNEILKRPVVTGASLAIRQKLLSQLTPFHESWIHDYWVSLALAAKSVVGKAIPEPLMDYRIHSKQQIGDKQAGILAQVKAVSKVAAKNYREEAEKLEDLSRMLDSTSCMAWNLILAKANHFRARADIQERARILRIYPILRELVKGNYRYSWSCLAPLRDMIA